MRPMDLDRVVPVGRLGGLEELERPTRAARAAHVHTDGGVAQQVRDRGAARATTSGDGRDDRARSPVLPAGSRCLSEGLG